MSAAPRNVFLFGDALAQLRKLPDQCVNLTVTSPPYLALRTYLPADHPDKDLELGAEATPEHYVARLVEIFAEVRRVLRDDGVLVVNLGDSHAGVGKSGGGRQGTRWDEHGAQHVGKRGGRWSSPPAGLRSGELIGVPWRLALAMQRDGWLLRAEIIWAKGVSFCATYSGACMPSSRKGWRWEQHRVKITAGRRGKEPQRRGSTPGRPQQDHNGRDFAASAAWLPCPGCAQCEPTGGFVLRRGSWAPTPSHEKVFVFAKSMGYFANAEAVRELSVMKPQRRSKAHASYAAPGQPVHAYQAEARDEPAQDTPDSQRNPRGVWTITDYEALVEWLAETHPELLPELGDAPVLDTWTINPEGVPERHYATFPPKLVAPLIRAFCPEQCCAHCGAPYAPITVSTFVPQPDVSETRGQQRAEGQKPLAKKNNREGVPRETTTVEVQVAWTTCAWTTCACAEDLPPAEYQGKLAETPAQSQARRMSLNTKARRDAGAPHDQPFSAVQVVGERATCGCGPAGSRATRPGLVLDPFAGSGTTLFVAEELGRDWLGFDLDERNLEIFSSRRARRGLVPYVLADDEGQKEIDNMGIDQMEAQKRGTTPEGERERLEGLRVVSPATAPAVYVTQLQGNFKRPLNVALGRKILLLGDNGAGKSAFVDTLALVTTGTAHSEGLGKGGDVQTEGSSDGQPVQFRAQLSTGETWGWPGGPARGSNLYTEVWHALRRGSAASLQSVVLRAAPQLRQSWPAELETYEAQFLPGAYHTDLGELVREALASGIGPESANLAAACDWLLAEVDRRLREGQSTLRQLQAVRLAPLTEEEEAGLDRLEHLARLCPDLAPRLRAQALFDQRGQALSEVGDVSARLTEAERQLQEVQLQRGAATAGLELLRTWQQGVGPYLHQLEGARDQPQVCLCCGSLVPAAQILQYQDRIGQAVAQAEQAAAAMRKYEQTVQALRVELQKRQQRVQEIEHQLRELQPFYALAASPDALRQRLNELRTRQAAVPANTALQTSAVEIEQQQQVQRALKTALQGIRSQLFELAVARAATSINYLLPPRLRVKLEASGNRGQGAVVRVAVDGAAPRVFRHLGGAEQTAVALALASAIAQQGRERQPALLIVDEVWLKRRRVSELIASVDLAMQDGTGPDQVVLSLVEYGGTAPSDWTVIDLDAKAEASAGLRGEGARVPSATPTALTATELWLAPPATPGLPCLIGQWEQPGQLPVPVYWLGACSRLTPKGQQPFLHVAVEGSYGLVLTPKTGEIRVVVKQAAGTCAVNHDPEALAVLTQMAQTWRAANSTPAEAAASSSAPVFLNATAAEPADDRHLPLFDQGSASEAPAATALAAAEPEAGASLPSA